MIIELKTRAGYICYCKVDGKEMKKISEIAKIYAENKGFSIQYSECCYTIAHKDDKCAEMCLDLYTEAMSNEEENKICGCQVAYFKQYLNNIINEIKEKINELNKEKFITIEFE